MGRKLGSQTAAILLDANVVRRQRVARGLSQDQLGATVGVSGAMISLVEKARRHVTPEMAESLASELHLDLHAMIVDERPKARSANGPAKAHIVAVVDDDEGVVAGLSGVVASHDLAIRSLATHSDNGAASVSMVIDAPALASKELLRSQLLELSHVHSVAIAPLATPAFRTQTIVPPGPGTALRLLSVGLPMDRGSVTILVLATDRVGLLHDLARQFVCNVRAVGTSVSEDSAFLWFVIDRVVMSKQKLSLLVSRLERVDGVEEIFVPTSLRSARLSA